MTMSDYYTKKELATIRKQLWRAISFANRTPSDGIPHHKGLWWTGEFPAYPKEYDPSEWQMENRPFAWAWSDYISELEEAGLVDYAAKAKTLPIADLLETGEPRAYD